jgi:cell division protein FtsW
MAKAEWKLLDTSLLYIIVSLWVVGMAMVFSASSALTMDLEVSSLYFFIKQLIATVIGGFGIFLLLRFDYRLLQQPKYYFTLLVIALAMLVLVLFLPSIKNTHRWISLGVFSFQPSEFAKIALVITLAAVSSRWKSMLASWGFILISLAALALPVIVLIAMEPDLGTSAVVAMSSMVVLFAAGIDWRKVLVLALIIVIALALYINAAEYRKDRIRVFMNPKEDPLGSGFQAIQSELTIGSGGVIGVGYMASKQKLFYLPAGHTDFIFSVIGEEWGFLGTSTILIMYVLLFFRGIRIAMLSRDLFGYLLAIGLTSMIVGQAFINMSVTTILFPTKGIPLPLVSYGGSSIIGTLIALGIILNISQFGKKAK